jgi:predicted nuclease with TOPRIM domain
LPNSYIRGIPDENTIDYEFLGWSVDMHYIKVTGVLGLKLKLDHFVAITSELYTSKAKALKEFNRKVKDTLTDIQTEKAKLKEERDRKEYEAMQAIEKLEEQRIGLTLLENRLLKLHKTQTDVKE